MLDRTFALIRILNTWNLPLTLTELSEHSGIPKSSTHRLLNALIDRKIVERVGNTYRTSRGVTGLGDEEDRFRILRDRLLPHLTRLCETTGYMAELAVLVGPETTVLCRTELGSQWWAKTECFERFPAHVTAAGKVLLAHDSRAVGRYLDTRYFHATNPETGISEVDLLREIHEIRRCSVAFHRVNIQAGRRSAATPVWGNSEIPAAALSVTADATVFREELVRKALLNAGRHSSSALR